MSKNKRIVGIEALRVISMIMIVLMHVLGQGGVLDSVKQFSPEYFAAWILEAFAYSSVDAFALISGYVGFGGKHRMSSAGSLCLMALFFDVIITVIILILGVPIGTKLLIGSLFPPLLGRHWYLTCYLCLFPLMPVLDTVVRNMTEKKARVLATTLLIFLSIIPTFVHQDFAGIRRGMSFAWLGALYVLGACVRMHGWFQPLKGNLGVVLYLSCSIALFLSRPLFEFITVFLFGKPAAGGTFFSYDSPLVLGAAIGLLMAFSNETLLSKQAKPVLFLSTSSFAVYVIHVVPAFFDGVLKNAFAYLATAGPHCMIVTSIGVSVIIYVVCCFIDKMRVAIFTVLGIDSITERLDGEKYSLL